MGCVTFLSLCISLMLIIIIIVIIGNLFLISKGMVSFFIQLKIANQFVTNPKHIPDAYGNYFKSNFNTSRPSVIPLILLLRTFHPLLLSLLLKSVAL
jgi:hypothetical protein